MPTTFAYEYYKRNRFALVVGTHKEERTPRLRNRDEGGHRVYYRDADSALTDNPIITGFYDAKPQTSFSSEFAVASNELDDLINMFKNSGNKLMGFIKAFNSGAAWEDIQKMLGNLLQGKTEEAKSAVNSLGSNLANATNAPQKTSMSPVALHWQGSAPISFSVKFIFIDKTGQGRPVTMGNNIKLLMSTVGSMGFTESSLGMSTMTGPLGYNSNVFGESAVRHILERNMEHPDLITSLHSLILKQGEVTVLDLRNILVITNVTIKTSEQLYIPSSNNEPSYKWITADVNFSTVCPIPAPLAATYTSMLSFYGINKAHKT